MRNSVERRTNVSECECMRRINEMKSMNFYSFSFESTNCVQQKRSETTQRRQTMVAVCTPLSLPYTCSCCWRADATGALRFQSNKRNEASSLKHRTGWRLNETNNIQFLFCFNERSYVSFLVCVSTVHRAHCSVHTSLSEWSRKGKNSSEKKLADNVEPKGKKTKKKEKKKHRRIVERRKHNFFMN